MILAKKSREREILLAMLGKFRVLCPVTWSVPNDIALDSQPLVEVTWFPLWKPWCPWWKPVQFPLKFPQKLEIWYGINYIQYYTWGWIRFKPCRNITAHYTNSALHQCNTILTMNIWFKIWCNILHHYAALMPNYLE